MRRRQGARDLLTNDSSPDSAPEYWLPLRDRLWLCIIGGFAAVASFVAAPGLPGALGGALALIMLTIAAIDGRHFIIPDALNAAALLLGLCNAAIVGRPEIVAGVSEALLRGACAAGAFLLIRFAYGRLRRREGIGLGDVKLAGVAGVWLNWALIPITVDIAAITALGAYCLIKPLGHQNAVSAAKLPFGLFFAPSIWLCWLSEAIWTASRHL